MKENSLTHTESNTKMLGKVHVHAHVTITLINR